jgi:hypothetical protein
MYTVAATVHPNSLPMVIAVTFSLSSLFSHPASASEVWPDRSSYVSSLIRE